MLGIKITKIEHTIDMKSSRMDTAGKHIRELKDKRENVSQKEKRKAKK